MKQPAGVFLAGSFQGEHVASSARSILNCHSYSVHVFVAATRVDFRGSCTPRRVVFPGRKIRVVTRRAVGPGYFLPGTFLSSGPGAPKKFQPYILRPENSDEKLRYAVPRWSGARAALGHSQFRRDAAPRRGGNYGRVNARVSYVALLPRKIAGSLTSIKEISVVK